MASVIAREFNIVADTALDFYFDYTDSLVVDKITQDIKSRKMKVYDSKDVYKELGIEL